MYGASGSGDPPSGPPRGGWGSQILAGRGFLQAPGDGLRQGGLSGVETDQFLWGLEFAVGLLRNHPGLSGELFLLLVTQFVTAWIHSES